MIPKLLIGLCLMALCVMIHATGVVLAFRWIQLRMHPIGGRYWPAVWLLIRVAGYTILVHLVQIVVWAFFYTWKGGMPDLATACYFSAVTYTTTGYGDLVLPQEWRLVGGVEALTGIMMCGLSTGFFFAVFTKIFGLFVDKTDPAAAR
jgi:hypothetical protein